MSVVFSFLNRFLLCSIGWSQICDPPASTSRVLELQVCTTIPGFKMVNFILRIFYCNDFVSSTGLTIRWSSFPVSLLSLT
jgi:hypothetical protein